MNKVIKFSAAWCGPCRAMAPLFEKFQKAHSDQDVEIIDVDVDKNYDLAEQYEVRSVPLTVFIKDGEVVNRISGMTNLEKLNMAYDEAFLAATA